MWGAGDEVKIEESLEVDNKSLEKGLVGRVVEGVGASAPCIKIDFGGDVGQVGVSKEQLFAQFCAKETQLQQTVRKARLTRVEVFVLVFYTGPMFLVYNAILRGFGTCGKVQEGIKFGCDEFWKSYSAFKVADRIAKSKNTFPSTIHVLASAIKKLQGSSENVQGSRLYRGLGGLDIRDFVKSRGFTERAFMSTTKSLKIAMEYSGIKDGKPASVLAMEVSKVDGGAVLGVFSQYPSEEETCWNACSYLEYVEGKDEVHVTDGGGVVKILFVKTSANSKAQTIEELEGQRKGIVMNMVKLLDSALGQELDAKALTPECLARVEADENSAYFNDDGGDFIPKIKKESAGRVAVYEAKAGVWFANNAHLGKAVSDGLALPGLAMGKFNLWMDDTSLNLEDTRNLNFQTAHLRGMQRRARLLAEAEAAGDGATVTGLALEDSVAKRYITDAPSLENPDEISGETALITQSFLGEVRWPWRRACFRPVPIRML